MIVLDTHAWVWWMSDPKRLSRRAAQAIERSHAIARTTASRRFVTRDERLRAFDHERTVW